MRKLVIDRDKVRRSVRRSEGKVKVKGGDRIQPGDLTVESFFVGL
jgi:hypothetical protein